jgi:hypothetical protein
MWLLGILLSEKTAWFPKNLQPKIAITEDHVNHLEPEFSA